MDKIVIGERLVKAFGEGDERRNVLDEVSIEIHAGEFVSVMGPSGSGKSTLLLALSGTDRIDGGIVAVDGKELSTLSDQELSDMRRRLIGFVFQQPTMLKNLNVLDNILLPALRDNRRNVAGLLEKAKLLMHRVGIAGLEEREITQVSGGQLQRAGICRALMNNPRIIFGDEPTGALNSQSAQEVMEILSEINREGTAMMIVTHDAKVAARAERVVFMRDGKLVSELKLPKYAGDGLEDRVEKVTARMMHIGI